jgi:hypothetical protein
VSTLAIAGAATAGPPPKHPIYESIAVPEATVNAVPVSGAEPDNEQEWLRQLLVGQATATGRRASIDRKLCRVVEAEADGYQLQIEIDVPTALPPGVMGSRAAFRKGTLAKARLQLLDEHGLLRADVEATVRWGQVRWTAGGHKVRRARPREAALIDAVEAAVNQAVRRLVRTLSSPA